MLSEIEIVRRKLSKTTDPERKSRLGRFFTPMQTAAFMAGLFPDATGECRLLDAGAGLGSLTAAFLERWRRGGFRFSHVAVDALEIDDLLRPELLRTLSRFAGADLTVEVHRGDLTHSPGADRPVPRRSR